MRVLKKRKTFKRKAPCRRGGVPCKDQNKGGIAVFGGGENKTWDDPEAENKADGEKGPSWGG